MRKIDEEKGFILWEDRAYITCPWENQMTQFSLSTSLRILTEYIFGLGEVSTYYLSALDGSLIGYCVVQTGAHPRYFFSTRRDIILGPYYIREGMRGQGFSVILIDWVLSKTSQKYRNVYAYIKNTNTPSIRCCEKCGMKRLYTVRISRRFKSLIEDVNGDYGVYGLTR